MKKTLIITLMIAFVFALSGVSVIASTSVNTGLTRDTSGGANPIVKAKWEMNTDRVPIGGPYLGTDDSPSAGAQFLPSGMKDVSKTIALCAVVMDPDGLADIDAVYADVFYPENIALGSSHVPLSDQSGDGCGELMQEDTLSGLDKQDGIDLI